MFLKSYLEQDGEGLPAMNGSNGGGLPRLRSLVFLSSVADYCGGRAMEDAQSFT
jgi:hypothetical protein